MFTVAGDFPDADVFMEDRHIGNLFELHSIELASHPEHAFAKVLKLEVLLHFLGIEVVFGLTDFLGIIAIVPRRDLDPGFFLVGNRLHRGDFLIDLCGRGWPHFQHQVHGGLRIASDGLLDRAMCKALIAEDLRAFGAQRHDLRDHVVIVILIAIVAARIIGAPDFLTQGAVV